jgi:FKBP-type peptidyl-prolyl cis-trans isomerase
MKLTHALIIFGLGAVSVMAQTPSPHSSPLLQLPQTGGTNAPVDKHKSGYAIGWLQGSSMKKNDIDVDYESVLKGLRDSLFENKGEMTEQEARDTWMKWQQEHRMAMMEKRKTDASKNKTAGEAFLVENGKKAGVITLPDGLQYKVLKEGTGATPKPGDTVSALYTGKLIDGKEFDSTASRGNQPFKFVVGQGRVIKGWDEAVQHMKVGAKWEIYVPANLAYGENGPGPIGPNQTLIFDLELLGVTAAPQPAANPKAGEGTQVVSGEIIKVPSKADLEKGAKIEVIKPGETNK